MGSSQYEQLGVDPHKKDVRSAFSRIIRNDFPGSFVNITRAPDIPGVVETLHIDGSGSKILQNLLIMEETDNPEVIRGTADDALAMNLGDIAASGFVFGATKIVDGININRNNTPKGIVMEQIGLRLEELLQLHTEYGFTIDCLGGETADLIDQVKSGTFDIAVSARTKETDIIKGNVQPGDKIYGFASNGQAAWEYTENSGIMSNGLTLARTGLMWEGYTNKYPHLIRDSGNFKGKYKVGDFDKLIPNMPVSEAIVSPTRQWQLMVRTLLEKLKDRGMYEALHGMSMNTGGGATKITHVGNGITYTKNMPTPPPIFQLIQRETDESWQNMFTAFNCGVGLDIVGANDPTFKQILREVSTETNIVLYEIGHCKASEDGLNHVEVNSAYGNFNY